jgi:hypothetical protein
MDYKELLRVVKEENIPGMLELINRSGMSYLDIIDEFEKNNVLSEYCGLHDEFIKNYESNQK